MTHTCHAVGCDVAVPPKMFMCKRHWFTLPERLRAAIWAAYRPGQERDKRPSIHYPEVTDECRRYVAEREGKLTHFEPDAPRLRRLQAMLEESE